MTTELVELADRPEFTVDEALRIADQNADSYEKVASVSRTLAAEVRRLRALASRAGGWLPIEEVPAGESVLVFGYPLGFRSMWIERFSHPNLRGPTAGTHFHRLPEPPAAPEPGEVG